ncbi:hypothetical protein BDQ17DRAFT_1423968 [Cyathus striatus]|nr:hypothetical protein BDQ17DRAFT_1423968 [Cyathus striatus]
MVQDAKILLESLDGPVTGTGSLSGSLAWMLAMQSVVNSFMVELQVETPRKVKLETQLPVVGGNLTANETAKAHVEDRYYCGITFAATTTSSEGFLLGEFARPLTRWHSPAPPPMLLLLFLLILLRRDSNPMCNIIIYPCQTYPAQQQNLNSPAHQADKTHTLELFPLLALQDPVRARDEEFLLWVQKRLLGDRLGLGSIIWSGMARGGSSAAREAEVWMSKVVAIVDLFIEER